MSDDPPETPTKAARALIGWFSGGLAFKSVDTFSADAVFAVAPIGYGLGAIAVAIIDYKLKAILSGSPRLTKSFNDIAANARLWVAVAMVSLILIALSPYIEQRRIPFANLSLPSFLSSEDVADAVVRKLPQPSSAPAPLSIDAIANAVIARLPPPKENTAQTAQFQIQLADAQRAAQVANQDAAAARSQVAEVQRQLLQQQQIQQTAQTNQFVFPVPPIKKRKLTHSEAVELIDKLDGFSKTFRILDKPMSEPLIPSQSTFRYGQPLPRELDKKQEMATDFLADLNKFRSALQGQISEIPSFKVELDEMLGGQNWGADNSLIELTQATQNYIQAISQITSRPIKPDDELTNYILAGPQSMLSRPAQKFNSWRNQMPPRIQELQNEARADM